jgi:hypothetical protein
MASSKKKTKIVLMGGLGNQLFQIAFGAYLSEVHSREVSVTDFARNLRKTQIGTPEVLLYDVPFQRIPVDSNFLKFLSDRASGLLLRCSLKKTSGVSEKILIGLSKAVFQICELVVQKRLVSIFASKEVGFQRWEATSKNITAVGYFQSYKYIENPNVLATMRKLKPIFSEVEFAKYEELAKTELPLLVHIRLGDYRQESSFGVLPVSYFHNAIRRQMSTQCYNCIWIFSDEIHEYKSYIPQEFQHLVRQIGEVGSNSVALLEVMKMCKGYVIANSTLSWWAATLSIHENPVVIYPEPWFSGIPTPNHLTHPSWFPENRNLQDQS